MNSIGKQKNAPNLNPKLSTPNAFSAQVTATQGSVNYWEGGMHWVYFSDATFAAAGESNGVVADLRIVLEKDVFTPGKTIKFNPDDSTVFFYIPQNDAGGPVHGEGFITVHNFTPEKLLEAHFEFEFVAQGKTNTVRGTINLVNA